MVLATYADEHGGSIYPSMSRLAKDCSMTRRGVQKIVRRLIASEWLVAEGRGANNVHIYRIQPANPVRTMEREAAKQAANDRTKAANREAPSCEQASSHKRELKGNKERELTETFVSQDPEPATKTVSGSEIVRVGGTPWSNLSPEALDRMAREKLKRMGYAVVGLEAEDVDKPF